MISESFLATLPNLSIGVIAVLSLAYLSFRHSTTQKEMNSAYIKALDGHAEKHMKMLDERETAMRSLEASVRSSLTDQLTRNTIALTDVTKVLGRVVRHLDGEK